MNLAIYQSMWGHTGTPAQAASTAAGAGYDGIEAGWPATEPERSALLEAAGDERLGLVLIVLLEGETAAVQLDHLRRCLEAVAPHEPDRLVVLSGRDSWPTADAIRFYERAVELELEIGIRCAHETHRGRSLATPWATMEILAAVPDLWLCCDFSHWVVACERLLEDQAEAIGKAASRALHLHARVGTAQAPQVAHPADSGVATELAAFERWWDLVWEAQESAGRAVSTLSPEYGPPPYQQATASAAALAVRLAEIRDWQAARARQRFGERSSPATRLR